MDVLEAQQVPPQPVPGDVPPAPAPPPGPSSPPAPVTDPTQEPPPAGDPDVVDPLSEPDAPMVA